MSTKSSKSSKSAKALKTAKTAQLFSPRVISRLALPVSDPDRRGVAELHGALVRLRMVISPDEVSQGRIGETTQAALRQLQALAGLPESGTITEETATAIKVELEHRYFADSKTRVARVQALLRQLGHPIDDAEAGSRMVGETTGEALRAFQRQNGTARHGRVDGKLSADLVERLRADALTARLSSRTQAGKAQRSLLRALRIGGLDNVIDPAELRSGEFGPTTRAAITAFQRKYRLAETGELDLATWDKIVSANASRPLPVRKLRPPAATDLTTVGKQLRLNMTGKAVGDAQQALAFLGFDIDVTEHGQLKFGKTTRNAVLAYQSGKGLPLSGHLDKQTLTSLNGEIGAKSPAAPTGHAYRLRGSVRDERWAGIGGVMVRVFDRPVRGQATQLAAKPTASNGFYDLAYEPPLDLATKQIRQPVSLRVTFSRGSEEIGSRILFNPTKIAWANLTLGDQPYRGVSVFDARMAALAKAVPGVPVHTLVETEQDQEVTRAAIAAGLTQDDVMRLVLSHLVSVVLGGGALTPAAVYGYIGQNLPPSLPPELLAATDEWQAIGELVDTAATGLAFLDAELAASAFDVAVTENLVPVQVTLARDAVLAALAAKRTEFALDKPILVGSGTLRSVLQASTLGAGRFGTVAEAFVRHQGAGEQFWAELTERAGELGGPAVVEDVRTTVDVATITVNHAPLLAEVKQLLAAPNSPVATSRDLAKLTVEEWQQIVEAGGGPPPAPPTGNGAVTASTADFAAELAVRAETLYPTVAFAAEVGRSGDHGLSQLGQISQFIDEQPQFQLSDVNVDAFVAEHAPGLAAEVVGELRVLQRASRLAPNAAAGRALLDAGVHSSSQIMGLGKDGLTAVLDGSGVPDKAINTMYGVAQLQYAQVLARLADFRLELQLANPFALSEQNITVEEAQEVLGELPNLEVLFGSLDYCDCAGCMSVYSPAAYLADLLRFLSNRPAEAASTSVLDVLLDRRPDLVDVKLNCVNTETPMPYIDLVCEVLENAVPGAGPQLTELQTTRGAAELRALPEHQRAGAYDLLRGAAFPLDGAFDLWQEEARLGLEHLSVPRHELMALFSEPVPTAGTPTPVSVAGEYFGISTHETALITTPAANPATQDVFWGFDTTRTQVSVAEFLRHARIDYRQLRELVAVRWVSTGMTPVALDRPDGTCDLEQQRLTGLTVATFDRMGRLLRLWRRTGWSLWQLDQLLRAPGVGAGQLNAAALVAMYHFALLGKRLKATFDQLLGLYRVVNTEAPLPPDDDRPAIPSQYDSLFRNPLVTNPLDPAFDLPLPGTEPMADHHAALAAAYQVTEAELALLLGRTGANLTLANLSVPLRFLTVARGLRLPVADVLTLVDLCAGPIPDPFAGPRATADVLDRYAAITEAGFSVAELDHLLGHRPDSPFELREETITQQVTGLRESLRTTPATDTDGQIAAYVATTFAVTDQQAVALLGKLAPAGAVLSHLGDGALTAQDAAGEYLNAVTPANFPDIYADWRLLHKAAIVVRRQRMDAPTLDWLLDNAATFGLLPLGDLPVAPPAAALFEPWRRLAAWLRLRRAYPEPEGATLAGLFDLAAGGAPIGDVQDAAAALTQWPHDWLAELDGGAVATYTDIEALHRMRERIGTVRRLGIDVPTARHWALRDANGAGVQRGIARAVGQTVKAKYDPDVWLERITPMQDQLRERKRDALVAFLVEHSVRNTPPTITVGGQPYANPAYWENTNDLLRYFLIDVEMSSCQRTSRIKQAISSVQMFVQRCQLNLERPFVRISAAEQADTSSLDSWRHWRWMKSYRIWEANRKVFCYPENWVEPELRDDKSPFFKELEDEILQQDITDANCEAAFSRYLHKVHEVSRLRVVGVYHEIDDDNPNDGLPPQTNLLHVVARTPAEPARYFYRRFDLNFSSWTPWERIDLDITGDHVVPVVYNRKLHLFWLIFNEKPQKVRKQPPAKASEAPTDSPEPPKQVEIQLAWSVRTADGFGPRSVGSQKLIHPWQRPRWAYLLKPRYKADLNHLWLDIYLSTTQQFNNTRFYDPYANVHDHVTKIRFDETARPWHSSSFVFDGGVVAVKLKPLAGFYRVLGGDGTFYKDPVPTNSYLYVHDSFGDDTRSLGALSGGYEIAPRLVLPTGMHFENTRLTNNRQVPNNTKLNVMYGGASTRLLNNARNPFELAMSAHHIQYDVAAGHSPMFYSDDRRSFFVRPTSVTLHLGGLFGYDGTYTFNSYRWLPSYHPYTSLFIRELNRSGLDGLLNRRIQRFPTSYPPYPGFNFDTAYQPAGTSYADDTAKTEIVDFTRSGAYSIYNWEIFFHAPMLIAAKLTTNQRFEEAMRWYHRIFDPTNTEAVDAPQRYWITKPFFDHNSAAYRRQRIEELLENIGTNLDQLKAWKNNPFNPHLIARYRPVAYQRAVVMRYIDNLVAWGDQLFRRDTLESINEATVLYVLAAELLGERPTKVPPVEHAERSYAELVADGALDPFGNTKVEVLMENYVGPPSGPVLTDPSAPPLPSIEVQYFGIPANDKLLGYWGLVADRLFKVRHCMNIEGVVRQLPLFEPPIDPALLVKAAAAGVDLSSVLGPSTATAGQYRFRVLADKAMQMCSDLRSLGERLLSVLSSRDAEQLALLRSANEIDLLKAVRSVREQQVDESQKSWAAMELGLPVMDKRISYYGSIPRMNAWEIASTVSHGLGIISEIVATVLNTVAGATAVIPQIKAGAAGFGGSPTLVVEIGGEQVSKSSTNFAAMFSGIAGILHNAGAMLSTQGEYTRQDEANVYNKQLAELERAQLSVQIEAARIRHAIATKELENQDVAIEQAVAVDEFMHSKYTNVALFDWMIAQVSTVYFQAYQLTYDMARRAEQQFQFELAEPTTTFVQFGYWDSLKKGLLAGDRLANDLRRMEAAYFDRHRREFEITKHVSLAEIAPLSLLALKLTGGATFTLPEWLFDLDHPGHYRRRLKSVSVSIPCVVGPYTGVNCTLSVTNNGVRLNDSVAGGYGDPLVGSDSRFMTNPVPTSRIATSHGVNDAGMFELNFSDERYLPFEGAGAVSEWRIDLPAENNRFDLSTITDVVLHLDYTAVAGGIPLANAARDNLDAVLPTSGAQLLILDEQFATQWHRFLNPSPGPDQLLELTLGPEHLPFWAKARLAAGATITISGVDLILDTPDPVPFEGRIALPTLGGGAGTLNPVSGPVDPTFGGMPHFATTPSPGTPMLGTWNLQFRKASDPGFDQLAAADIRRAYLLVRFGVTS